LYLLAIKNAPLAQFSLTKFKNTIKIIQEYIIMNKTDLLFKLLAIPIIAVIMFACSPKNTEKQKALGEENIDLQTESETVRDSATVSIPDSALDNKQLSSAGPPAYNFSKYLDFERKTHSAINIWGWSRDGKVAYSNYVSFEGDVFYVFIFDIINDKVLWQSALDLFNDPHPYEEGYNWFTGNFYLDFINNFKKVCSQNEIEFIQAEFKDIPIKHDNQTVNIILEKNKTPLSSLERENLLIIGGDYDSYKIIATYQGKQKIIKEKSLAVYADDVFICGYFMSPFENRALIVIGEFAHSWEGSDVTYSFAGCHLSNGFR
jgi:hypothetical protein